MPIGNGKRVFIISDRGPNMDDAYELFPPTAELADILRSFGWYYSRILAFSSVQPDCTSVVNRVIVDAFHKNGYAR